MSVAKMTRAERDALVEEATQAVLRNIPSRNQPTIKESTDVLGMPTHIVEKHQEREEARVAHSENVFERRRGGPPTTEERTAHLAELLLTACMVDHNDGTSNFRYLGTGDAFLAHKAQDFYGKTDFIPILPNKKRGMPIITRADACIGEDTLTKKVWQNLDALKKDGHMGNLPSATLDLIGIGKIQAGGLIGTPRVIAAIGGETTLRLAQKFVRLERARKAGQPRKFIEKIERDIETDEVSIMVLEGFAKQFAVYHRFAVGLLNQVTVEIDAGGGETLQERRKTLSGTVRKLLWCMEAAKATYEERLDELLRAELDAEKPSRKRKKGFARTEQLKMLQRKDPSYKRLMAICEHPEIVAAIAQLTSTDFKK
jgi:hypothetical protein